MNDLAVVILTLNESRNLPKAIASLDGFAPVFVVDSGSTDETIAIARAAGAEIVVHPFQTYADQRNFAIEQLRTRYRWVLFLDADEELTAPLRNEILSTLDREDVDGAYLRYSIVMLGFELKHGAVRNAAVLRLMRTNGPRFCRTVNERVDDRDLRTVTLKHPFVHADMKDLAAWFRKHVTYAERESQEYGRDQAPSADMTRMLRTKAGRMVIARALYDRMPLFVRPLLNFGRVTVLQHAWRDGIPGLMFAAMQGLWYPMMTDLLIYEKRLRSRPMSQP